MISHFRKLWNDLPRIREMAASLESPNVEDDQMVKIAIVGYSYHQPAQLWGRDEFDFVDKRRREVKAFDPKWVEFVCVAPVYLLGLYQAGQFNDAQCAQFEAILPGYMWQHSEQFTSAVEADFDTPSTRPTNL